MTAAKREHGSPDSPPPEWGGGGDAGGRIWTDSDPERHDGERPADRAMGGGEKNGRRTSEIGQSRVGRGWRRWPYVAG